MSENWFKDQKIAYFYDSFKRLIEVKRYPVSTGSENVCQNTKFYFDVNPFDATFTEYGYGRPTATEYKVCTGATSRTVRESLSYTVAGQVVKQKFGLVEAGSELMAQYGWDSMGRLSTITYPQSGAVVTNSFDSMGRLSAVNTGGADWASGATYGPGGELLSLELGYRTETRAYNTLGQLTRLKLVDGGSTYADLEYRFSSTQNNGRITQMKDWVGGEEVNYTYDALNRLVAAYTTGTEWGNSYQFDGFGNLTGKTVTKGSAPALSVAADPATNRIVGLNYDANGNQKPFASGNYFDIENRLMTWDNNSYYGYKANNRRILKYNSTTGVEEYSFWGVNGKVLGTYSWTAGSGFTELSRKVYFLARELGAPGAAKVYDRLGSQVHEAGATRSYFPWGEDKANSTEFATYQRDTENTASGLKYADQRYFSSTNGRFTSPDPFYGSANTASGSWNRYGYVTGDPANNNDPAGLQEVRIDPIPGNQQTQTQNPYAGLIGLIIFRLEEVGNEDNVLVPLPDVPDIAQESTRMGRQWALYAMERINKNCGSDLAKPIKPGSAVTIGYDLFSAIDRMTVIHEWDAAVMNTGASTIFGGKPNGQTVMDVWTKLLADNGLGPSDLAGVTNGNVIFISSAGASFGNTPADPNLGYSTTLIHELFHVGAFSAGSNANAHLAASTALGLVAGQNGYPMTDPSGLIDHWIAQCLGDR